MPKLYDQNVLSNRSIRRDRETRVTNDGEVTLTNPKCIYRHGNTEFEGPLEEDKPLPPPEPKEEGEEEEAAAAPVGEGEGETPAAEAEGGESSKPEEEQAAPERRIRCEVRYPISQLGSTREELANTKGTITLQCTEPVPSSEVGEVVDCQISISVSIFTESETVPDFQQWTTTLATNFKNYAEKMLYLCPQVLNSKSPQFVRTILSKAKRFNFIKLSLSRSPSALALMRAGSVQGSLGFYLNNKTKSPVPIGLNTRAKSAMA